MVSCNRGAAIMRFNDSAGSPSNRPHNIWGPWDRISYEGRCIGRFVWFSVELSQECVACDPCVGWRRGAGRGGVVLTAHRSRGLVLRCFFFIKRILLIKSSCGLWGSCRLPLAAQSAVRLRAAPAAWATRPWPMRHGAWAWAMFCWVLKRENSTVSLKLRLDVRAQTRAPEALPATPPWPRPLPAAAAARPLGALQRRLRPRRRRAPPSGPRGRPPGRSPCRPRAPAEGIRRVQKGSDGFRRMPKDVEGCRRIHQQDSEGFRRSREESGGVRRSEKASECIRRHPKASEGIRRHQKGLSLACRARSARSSASSFCFSAS